MTPGPGDEPGRDVAARRTDAVPDDDPAALAGLDLTTAGIAEMLPGVLPPLWFGINRLLVEEALHRMLDGLDVLPAAADADHRLIRRVRGRAALDFATLAGMTASLPSTVGRGLEAGLFGAATPDAAASAGSGRGPAGDLTPGGGAPGGRRVGSTGPRRRSRLPGLDAARHDLRVAAVRRRAVADAEVCIGAARDLVTHDASTSTRPGGNDAASELLALLDLALRAMGAEVAVAADAAALYHRLEQALASRLPADRAAVLAGALTAAVPLPTPHPLASAAVFGGPTWAEQGRRPPVPDPAACTPAGRRGHGPGDPGGRAEPIDAVGEALAAAGRDPGAWRIRLHLRAVRRLAAETTDQLARREAAKAAVLTIGGAARRAVLEAGAHLTIAGRLAGATDVELLTPAELFAALRGAAVPGPTVLRARRLALERCEAEGPLPLRFRGETMGRTTPGVPAPTPQATGPSEGSTMAPPPEPDGPRSEPDTTVGTVRRSGTGGSSGRAEGRARAVRRPTDPFDDGDVLLAVTTDPSWLPLLLQAGAVVLEQGGTLSHAAVTARDLAIPAVLGVEGACALFDGRWVVVDGDRGTVTAVDGEEPG